MKKIILLAVVVFGFTAISLAQNNVVQAGVGGQINLAPAANASFWIGSLNDLDFGILTNKATSGNNATVSIAPTGTVTPNAFVTVAGSPKPAKFLAKGCDTPIVAGDLVLTGYTDHTISGGHAFFDTSSAATPNAANCGATNYTSYSLVPGQTTQYYI